MTAFNISGPGAGGNGFVKGDHLGHLVAFVGATEEARSGDHGKYVAARCSTVICADDHQAWVDTDVSGAALAPRILSATGEIVCGRLTQGEAKEGRSAPFLLDEPSADDIELLDTLFSKYAGKMPSGRVMFEAEAFNNDRPSLI